MVLKDIAETQEKIAQDEKYGRTSLADRQADLDRWEQVMKKDTDWLQQEKRKLQQEMVTEARQHGHAPPQT